MLQRGHACRIILVYLARHMYYRKVHVLQRALMQVSPCATKGLTLARSYVCCKEDLCPPNWVCVDLTLALYQLCCKESVYNIKWHSVTKGLCAAKGPMSCKFF